MALNQLPAHLVRAISRRKPLFKRFSFPNDHRAICILSIMLKPMATTVFIRTCQVYKHYYEKQPQDLTRTLRISTKYAVTDLHPDI